MTEAEALKTIIQQEQDSALKSFNQKDLDWLVSYLIKTIHEADKHLTVRVNKGKQILFHLANNDDYADRDNWVRRKINTVYNFSHSSLWLYYKTNGDSSMLSTKYGLDVADYTVSGGAVPIIVQNVGVVGALVISGYSGTWDDHNLAIQALTKLKEYQNEN